MGVFIKHLKGLTNRSNYRLIALSFSIRSFDDTVFGFDPGYPAGFVIQNPLNATALRGFSGKTSVNYPNTFYFFKGCFAFIIKGL